MGIGAAAILLGLLIPFLVGNALIPSDDEIDDFINDFEDDDDPRATPPATEGNDDLELTDGPDQVSGGAGFDEISGGKGFDFLRGGSGTDVLRGDEGKDVLGGNSGPDALFGGGWDDVLDGGSSGDLLNGGVGADRLFGRSGGDTLIGDNGADLLVGNDGTDTLTGGDGKDVLVGGDYLDREPFLRQWRDAVRDDDPTRLQDTGEPQTQTELSDDRRTDRLFGGNGDDLLLLGEGDEGEGGADEDTFAGIHVTDDSASDTAAEVSDYDPAEDILIVYYDTDTAPAITVEDDGADAVVLADGVPTLRVIGAAGNVTPGDVATTTLPPDWF
ncbi:MAG: calcium-binding protein [Pseudomonadota bacterium]